MFILFEMAKSIFFLYFFYILLKILILIFFFIRQKAIKLLKDKYFPDDSLSKSIGKIENEIKVLRHLDNPLVLKYYEYFLEYDESSEQASLAILTEYCPVGYSFLILTSLFL